MANSIPVPRSYSEILGEMIDAFVSRFGIRALKIGSPVLSLLESAAQSDLRSSEDIFSLLAAISLDQAVGVALDRIGADEEVPRETESPASGPATVSDTSFLKISSKIFQGTPAPIVGSVNVNVVDASLFPASGSIYLGRGTSSYEGPIVYTGLYSPNTVAANAIGTSAGNYWTIVLSTGTLRFHNLGEGIVVAQGGDRQIVAGSISQTPQGNVVNAIQFKTLYSAVIPDGEVSIDGVTVVSLKPGTIGNVGAKSIGAWASPPFTGAAIINEVPFTNGVASETDDSYRERIRQARQSRVKGTSLAIQTAAVGVTAIDENKRVLSSSVITRTKAPTVLYIDDGTGYEEKSAGIAIESFIDLAVGGEYYAKTSIGPVAKASVVTTEIAPFTLVAGQQLSFDVGGVPSAHTFNADAFRSISNATAYEVVASINSDPTLGWSARTSDSGAKVAVFAKTDTNESIQNIPLSNIGTVIVDANTYLGFPSGRVDTMRLYLNDRLLNKDGIGASIVSNATSQWAALSSPQDLKLQVDGTPLANLVSGTYTFLDQDFIDANTGYTTVGRNSPTAWTLVFNNRIPGIKAVVVNGQIVISSSQGLSAKSKLFIAGGSLVTNGMFQLSSVPVVGANSDYELDRNTGELRLGLPLSEGDRLAAGSVNTRAFLESPAFNTINVLTAPAHFWFAADAAATIIPSGLTSSTVITWSSSHPSWGYRQRATAVAGIFSNVRVGDWIIFWDPTTPSPLLDKVYRVATIDEDPTTRVVTGSYIEFDIDAVTTPGTFSFINAGVSFVRTVSRLQDVSFPVANNYTASAIAPLLTAGLAGAKASVYRTTAVRVNTSTFDETVGDIALVAADIQAAKFGLTVTNSIKNLTGHLGSVESGNSEIGTPDFLDTVIASATGAGNPDVTRAADSVYGSKPLSDSFMVGALSYPDSKLLAGTRYGNNNGFSTPITGSTGTHPTWTIATRHNPNAWFIKDRAFFSSPYRLTPEDSLSVLIDQDTDQKRFIVPLWRTLKTTSSTYASTNTFVDGDNGNQSLAIGFGYTGANPFDFTDFAVFMAARGKTHNPGDLDTSILGGVYNIGYNTPAAEPNTNRTILWRYFRLGPDGNNANVSYTLPAAPDSSLAVIVDDAQDIGIVLASSGLRTGITLPDSYPIGTAATTTVSGITTMYYILAYKVASLSRSGTDVQFTLTLPSGVTSSGLDLTGATSYYFVSTTGDFATQNVSLVSGAGAVVHATVAGPAFGPDANAGVLYFAATTTATVAGATPAVAQGNFINIGSNTSLPSAFKGVTGRIQNDVVADPYTIKIVYNAYSGGLSATPTFTAVGDASAFKIYGNPAQTATTIAAAVNALATTNPTVPVRAKVIGNGIGVIDRASYEELALAACATSLSDGYNFINAQITPGSAVGNYQFSFKDSINGTLATSSDWANEIVKIVPRTALNAVNWLNAPTVSGLFTSAEVSLSSGAHKVQIASLTPGSGGSVQVQGGTANSVTAPVLGSGRSVSNRLIATIKAASAIGMMATAWVSIDNDGVLPKAVFGTGTVLNSIAASGPNDSLITLSNSDNIWTASANPTASALVMIEQVGRYWVITDSGLGAVIDDTTAAEGDWVRISAPLSNTYFGNVGSEAVALTEAGNIGIFRVVRVVHRTDLSGFGGQIWIENAAGAAQSLAECDIKFFTYDSIIPGDTLTISTPAWDGATSNKGTYTVVDVGNLYTNRHVFTVVGNMAVIGSPRPALGAAYRQVQILEGTPTRLIKQIAAITPNQIDGTLYDIKFTSDYGWGRVGATPGSIISVSDKLEFPLSVAKGVDGYRYSTGLIAEVNKVVYGDQADSTTYPGVAAAGALINIQGPLVKRIQVTLSIRIRTGAARADILDQVKSAVAAVINRAGIGESIALSDLIQAAQAVGGVVSVVMVDPVATATNDLIPIQPYEKGLVLNVDQDVLVSFVGI